MPQTLLNPNTAPTWDSFKPTLIKVLAEFKPKTVLEWGPGVSTLLMQDFPSVEHIDTIEHDVAWYSKWKNHFGPKVNLILEENTKNHPLYFLSKNHDLYFIDGRERELCLNACGKPTGIVILHDAERESYQFHIKLYKYIFFEDGGHTAVLCNDEETGKKLESIFD